MQTHTISAYSYPTKKTCWVQILCFSTKCKGLPGVMQLITIPPTTSYVSQVLQLQALLVSALELWGLLGARRDLVCTLKYYNPFNPLATLAHSLRPPDLPSKVSSKLVLGFKFRVSPNQFYVLGMLNLAVWGLALRMDPRGTTYAGPRSPAPQP